ncbi:hypothetical protein Bca52824_082677 [Brassica carinata]|uniref:Uncharacterized protein n=1 Tax=Brassica carinata TaxID=52824 RepID=A0A8X7TT49_BRACI|nr:hypothetical protein Bca52824_082677 [Brassica carinata]
MEIKTKRYWRRWRGYEKLDGSSTPGRRSGKQGVAQEASGLVTRFYVNMMMRLANSRAIGTYGGSGFGQRQMKEYDEKVLVEIYKSILMAQAQGNLVQRDAANKLPSEPAVVPVSSVLV